MKLTQYSVDGGPRRDCLRVNWVGLPKGFIVRRYTQQGFCSGHLTGRGGWGSPEQARVFNTPQEAVKAATGNGCRIFIIAQNVASKRMWRKGASK